MVASDLLSHGYLRCALIQAPKSFGEPRSESEQGPLGAVMH